MCTGSGCIACMIANALIDKGYPVLVTNFARVLSTLQGTFDKQEYLDSLNQFKLLVIDDLGTEFKTAFSETAVYQIINNAILNGKPMIISSNLSIDELEERYGQRVVSRLNSFEVVNFIGTDIRQIKK